MKEGARKNFSLFGLIAAIGLMQCLGLRWGMPNAARASMVLPPQAQESPEFFVKLEESRKERYEMSFAEHVAAGYPDRYFSRPGEIVKYRGWENPWHQFLLLAYSSFLVRTMDGDEQIFLTSLSRMNPRKFDFNPHHYTHAGLYIYSLGALLKIAGAAGWIRLVPDIKFYYRHPDEMAKFFLVGRMYSLFWGFVGAWFLFRLVRRLFDPNAGIMAAFFYLAVPVTWYSTHVLKGHTMGAAFVFALLAGCVRIMSQGRRLHYLAYSFFAGMIVGTQPHLWFNALALPWAHAARGIWVDRKPWKMILLDSKLWLQPALGAIGFLSVSPYIFTAFKEWFTIIVVMGSDSHPMSFLPWQWLKAWGITLPLGLNTAVFILAAGGLFRAAKNLGLSSPPQKFLILFTLSHLALFGVYTGRVVSDSAIHARYFMPLMGLLCLYAGTGITNFFLSKNLRWPGARKSVAALLTAYTLGVGFFYCDNFLKDFKDASYQKAGRWIAANIPKHSSIGLKHIPHTDFTPPFKFGEYELWANTLSGHLDPDHDELPQFFILTRNPNYFTVPIRLALPFENFSRRYELLNFFGRRPRWWDFTDHFSGANFPIWIYKRRS